jgi:hypothetical protein
LSLLTYERGFPAAACSRTSIKMCTLFTNTVVSAAWNAHASLWSV